MYIRHSTVGAEERNSSHVHNQHFLIYSFDTYAPIVQPRRESRGLPTMTSALAAQRIEPPPSKLAIEGQFLSRALVMAGETHRNINELII